MSSAIRTADGSCLLLSSCFACFACSASARSDDCIAVPTGQLTCLDTRCTLVRQQRQPTYHGSETQRRRAKLCCQVGQDRREESAQHVSQARTGTGTGLEAKPAPYSFPYPYKARVRMVTHTRSIPISIPRCPNRTDSQPPQLFVPFPLPFIIHHPSHIAHHASLHASTPPLSVLGRFSSPPVVRLCPLPVSLLLLLSFARRIQ